MTRKPAILLSLLLFFISAFKTKAQQDIYGNEWINYEQSYFKFKITKDGVYRINHDALNSAFLQAGLSLNAVHPSWFQVFGRGEQIHIYIKDEMEPDGVFDSNDFIEFYAKKNDGWLDVNIYENQEQPNPNYSLFNDTATYYLTWNPTEPKQRITLETDVNFSSYTPANYFIFDSRIDYTSSYFAGETDYYNITEPEYTSCEGWFDGGFSIGGSISKNIPTSNAYTSAEDAHVKFFLLGQSNNEHHVLVEYANQSIDTIYSNFIQISYSASLAANQLGSSNTNFTFTSIDDLGSNADRNTIAYISVKYPHTFDLESKNEFLMTIKNSAESKSFINASNFSITSGEPFVYDLSNNKKITAILDEGNIKALIPNTGQDKLCYLTSEGNINNIAALSPANGNSTIFTDYENEYGAANYYILTNSSFLQKSKEYEAYRNSTGFNALAIDADELYNQFSYGINKHPLAIRNFMNYALNEFDSIPRYLFIIGKGYPAQSYRKNSSVYANTIVPAIGNPSTDILYTGGLNNTIYQPAVPTGRLAARNTEHIDLYLEKIMQYEQAQNIAEEWMKYALHFGGGSSQNEQTTLAGYLRTYENILEDTLFGGFVRTFLKTSPDPIQFNQSDSLKEIINNGVSLMTFFGHAAGIGFDQSIDDINEYNNIGKYPFLLANSCFAGDIFSGIPTTSEEFVLVSDKGMIGFLASTTASISSFLNLYSSEFYKEVSYKNYGNSVGNIMKSVVNTIESNPGYVLNKMIMKTCQIMQLHGDPAIKINSHTLPDYLINDQSFFTSPYEVSTEQDSFYVNLIIANIGKALGGTYTVKIDRYYTDNTSDLYLKEIDATKFRDTLRIKMPVDKEKGVGLNQIVAEIDYNNDFEELSETNNLFTYNFFIKSTDIIPVYPYEYSIIPDANIQLKASSGDPFGKKMDYIFQIDTTDQYNSPLFTEQKLTGVSGVISWTPPVSLQPNIVYYWRTRIDSAFSDNPIWRESSFKYVPNMEGWSQSHFYQFKNNNYRYVNFNRAEHAFDFVNNKLLLLAQNGYNILYQDMWYKINGTVQDYRSCVAAISDGGFQFAVFDTISGKPWESIYDGSNFGQFGNYHCYKRVSKQIEFSTSATSSPVNISREEWHRRMLNFIDTIPSGSKVLVWSFRNVHTEFFNDTLFEAFEKLGSNYIRDIQNGNAFILFGTKQDFPHPGTANEVVSTEPGVIINLEDSITTNWDEGYIESKRIGPAKQWQTFTWNPNNNPEDSLKLAIIGIKLNEQKDTLFSNVEPETLEIDLSNTVNANIYPYLQLIAYMSDDSLRTPAQLQNWNVYFKGVPETAIDPSMGFFFYNDTIAEGDQLKFSTAIHNISNLDMDSLLVNYWIVDKNRQKHIIDYPRQKPHPAGDAFLDTIFAETKGLAGLNSLWIEVNPNNDQLEQYHFNNLGQLLFYVEEDKTNPLLDVTFDGVHILNGDIVSAKPLIQITLDDENRFLELNDTSLFKVYLKYPEQEVAEQVYFNNNGEEIMRFIPADGEDNNCKIEYLAEFPQDGVYELLVQAKDATGNESGDIDYKISFEVINKSTITKVMNWPNPFSTRTHFVFTLTGSQIPDYFKIQIITVTGKLVREITMDELGSIHVGRNITDYAWDGRDQYGDKLGNGVYLYRVIARLNGESIENRATGADKYFKKEFGKMYIMR